MRARLATLLAVVFLSTLATQGTAEPAVNYREMLLPSSPWRTLIPANPALDPNSAALVRALSGQSPILDITAYGIPVHVAAAGAPRFTVTPTNTGTWGANPFGPHNPVPVVGTPAPGSDGWLVVVDSTRNLVFEYWQMRRSGTGWTCTWGSVYPWRGTGTTSDELAPKGRGNGAGVNVAAGIVKRGEAVRIAAATPEQIIAGDYIPHALSFSSSQINGAFRHPASKADHSLGIVPAGARIQLDPGLDLNLLAAAGAPKIELAVARALQRYGAYLYDTGGAKVAFIAEGQGSFDPWRNAGAGWDYYGLSRLPLDRLRVLRAWDGS